MKFIIYILATVALSACHQSQSAQTSPYIITPGGDTIQRIVKTEEQWKSELSELEYYVLREAGTERAWSGAYNENHGKGTYLCRGCGFPLFSSTTKFNSGSGWPSYYAPINKYAIRELKDSSLGMLRSELICARCDGHLGHVFDDGPKPTGLRYCVNSAALSFQKK